MAWTTPKTWVLDEIVDETDLNTHVRDNLRTLYPDYATTLPVSPYDAKQAILVDSTTTPTYHWHMRYNASNSTSYKWEFIGGAPMLSNMANVSHANVTTFRISTVTMTVPIAGVYDTTITSPYHTGSGGTAGYAVGINAATTTSVESIVAGTSGALAFTYRYTFAASDVLTVAYRAISGSISYNLLSAQIRLTPVRLA